MLHIGLELYTLCVIMHTKVGRVLSIEADTSRNHDVWRKLGSLNHAIHIHLTLLPDSQNTVVLIVYTRVEIEVSVVSEKHLLCSCHWQTFKKFSAAFKIVSEMTRAGTRRNAVREDRVLQFAG